MYTGYQPILTQAEPKNGEKCWRPIPGTGKGKNYRPSKQEFILSRSEKELLIGGSRGGAKTETGLAWGMEKDYITNPRFMGLVIRKNYEDLNNWTKRAEYFYNGLARIVGKPSEIRWNSGAVTRLGHWKDKNTIGQLIGHEYQKINVEEVTQTIETKNEYNLLMSCCRSTIPGLKAQFFGSTNPGGPGHKWVYDYFVAVANMKPFQDPGSGNYRLFVPTNIEDNPILIKNDPGYYNYLRSLPEPLRSAWYEGKWDVLFGQHFKEFGEHLRTEPWYMGDYPMGRLFGGLDIGIGHPTSFGLYYLAPDGHIELLFTYLENGHNHRWHAEKIFENIAGFQKYTNGHFPMKIFCGHDIWRRAGLNDGAQYAPIDEYLDVFGGKDTEFVRANLDKPQGCALIHRVFSKENGAPPFGYWKDTNEHFELGISTVITDDKNMEQYSKMTGDDTVDQFRYALMGMCSEIADQKQQLFSNKTLDVIPMNIDPFVNHRYSGGFKQTGLA